MSFLEEHTCLLRSNIPFINSETGFFAALTPTYLINQGQTLHGDSVRLPPISHQRVIYLCPSYDAGLTCTKMQITDF